MLDATHSPAADSRFRILLVEDDEVLRLSLEGILNMAGLSTITAASFGQACRALDISNVDLVVTDIRLPDGNGRELFERVMHSPARPPVILMTGFGSIADAVSLTKAGAVNYLEKPFDSEAFLAAVRRALSDITASRPATDLRPIDDGAATLGRSPAMRRIENLILRLRDVDSPVLITGESGTGKEVLARIIHRNSCRADGYFARVSCVTRPAERLEAELFGEAASASGVPHLGRFSQAAGGTVFLDDIVNVPGDLQMKLAVAIQRGMVERVGDSSPIALDARVIAASQEDLRQAVAAGNFLPDLYWGLNVIAITVPPLRERPEDIMFFANVFLRDFAARAGKDLHGLSDAAAQWLMAQTLPANLWELRTLLARAVALSAGPRVERRDLEPLDADAEIPLSEPSLKDIIEEAEQAGIVAALSRHAWVIGRTADALDVSRKTLWEKMRRYGIERPRG